LCLRNDPVPAILDALAAEACRAIQRLEGREASVVRCSVLDQGARAFAMVMLREQPEGAFRSGTASDEGEGPAVIGAVLNALSLDDGVMAAVADRWRAESGVSAVTLIQRDALMPGENNPDVDTHIQLARIMPAPGRLAVTTDDAEYRVLRFPAMAAAVSAAPRSPVLQEIDGWMARAEVEL
jgi:hypothetical protein